MWRIDTWSTTPKREKITLLTPTEDIAATSLQRVKRVFNDIIIWMDVWSFID
jgi:hypothetical protein